MGRRRPALPASWDGGRGSWQGGLPGAHGAPALPCRAPGLPRASARTPCSGTEAPGRASWRRKRPGGATEGKEGDGQTPGWTDRGRRRVTRETDTQGRERAGPLLGPKSETETRRHRKQPDAGSRGREGDATRREPQRHTLRQRHTQRQRRAETPRGAHTPTTRRPRPRPWPTPLTEAADLAAQAEAAALLGYGAQHVLQRALLGLRAARRLRGGGGGGGGGEGGRPGPEPRGRGRRGAGPARRPRGGHAGPRLIARAAPAGAPGAPRRPRPGTARREHQ